MPTLTKECIDLLAVCILRNKLWATPEETAEWLKTERGQLIHALILKEQERMKREDGQKQ